MKLGHHAIADAFLYGGWQAYLYNERMSNELLAQIGPNSIDVTLSNRFLRPRCESGYIDPYHPGDLEWDEIYTEPDTPLCLPPHGFMLGAVRERFWTMPPINVLGVGPMFFTQMYEGRSTCGRIGLASHVTAGFGDYGFSGAFTLELVNHMPYAIFLWPGMRIGQVAFEAVAQPSTYAGAYANSCEAGPVAPLLGKDRFIIKPKDA